jgi:hypothetical protein
MKGDYVLNVTMVLPNGKVIKTRRRARKSAAGWDVTKLFLGAEGTLGVRLPFFDVQEITIDMLMILLLRSSRRRRFDWLLFFRVESASRLFLQSRTLSKQSWKYLIGSLAPFA